MLRKTTQNESKLPCYPVDHQRDAQGVVVFAREDLEPRSPVAPEHRVGDERAPAEHFAIEPLEHDVFMEQRRRVRARLRAVNESFEQFDRGAHAP